MPVNTGSSSADLIVEAHATPSLSLLRAPLRPLRRPGPVGSRSLLRGVAGRDREPWRGLPAAGARRAAPACGRPAGRGVAGGVPGGTGGGVGLPGRLQLWVGLRLLQRCDRRLLEG